jgi:hypothetical protein
MLDFPPKPCTVLNRHLVPGVRCCTWFTAVRVNSNMRTHIPGLDQISWIKTYPQKSPTLLKPRDLPKDIRLPGDWRRRRCQYNYSNTVLFILGLLSEALYRMHS